MPAANRYPPALGVQDIELSVVHLSYETDVLNVSFGNGNGVVRKEPGESTSIIGLRAKPHEGGPGETLFFRCSTRVGKFFDRCVLGSSRRDEEEALPIEAEFEEAKETLRQIAEVVGFAPHPQSTREDFVGFVHAAVVFAQAKARKDKRPAKARKDKRPAKARKAVGKSKRAGSARKDR